MVGQNILRGANERLAGGEGGDNKINNNSENFKRIRLLQGGLPPPGPSLVAGLHCLANQETGNDDLNHAYNSIIESFAKNRFDCPQGYLYTTTKNDVTSSA